MRVSTGCSIFRRVAASCATTTKFINSYNLYFIGSKALGWTEKMSEGILAIILLESIALVGLPVTYQKPLN